MKYCSTRGKVSGLSFKDALFSGYCADGGLFVPEVVPKFSPQQIRSWMQDKPTYSEIVYEVARMFISEKEISNEDLRRCVKRAHSSFQHERIIGTRDINWERESGSGFRVAELFHGPTTSFKDYALSLVGQLMEYFLQETNENVIILVGTSGDTGSAAIHAVQNLDKIDIIVLYPKGKISPIQELQMNSSGAKNVHVYEVEGTSDDLDVPIKKCFPDKELCSINSINWARVMIQAAHYVYLYFLNGDELDIFVPTGACGNICGGLVASLMGIPLKLFPTTNENDNVEAFLNKGVLQIGGSVIETPANAMDIRSPYNVERIIYFLSKSADFTDTCMRNCESSITNKVQLDDQLLDGIKTIFPMARTVKTEEILQTMELLWKNHNYMVCPHTATAVAHWLHVTKTRKKQQGSRQSVVIATASPKKFPEVAKIANISADAWDGEELHRVLGSKASYCPNTSMTKDSDWQSILQDKIRSIKAGW